MRNLTQSVLKDLLSYNPKTGIFTWRTKRKKKEAGWKDQTGYIYIGVNGNTYKAHRLAFLYMEGEFPPHEVDHVNGRRDDNSWNNLRSVSRLDNMRNQGKYICNTSGHTGVFWHRRLNKWQSNIRNEGKLHHIGYYDNIEEAIAARKLAEKQFGFHPNHGVYRRVA